MINNFDYIIDTTIDIAQSIKNKILDKIEQPEFINDVKDLYKLCDKALKQIEEKLCKYIDKQHLNEKNFYIKSYSYDKLIVYQNILGFREKFNLECDFSNNIFKNLNFFMFLNKNDLGLKIFKKYMCLIQHLYINTYKEIDYLKNLYEKNLNSTFDLILYGFNKFLNNCLNNPNTQFEPFFLKDDLGYKLKNNYFNDVIIIPGLKLSKYKINEITEIDSWGFVRFISQATGLILSDVFFMKEDLSLPEKKKLFNNLIENKDFHKIKKTKENLIDTILLNNNSLTLPYNFFKLIFEDKNNKAKIKIECNLKSSLITIRLNGTLFFKKSSFQYDNIYFKYKLNDFVSQRKILFPDINNVENCTFYNASSKEDFLF